MYNIGFGATLIKEMKAWVGQTHVTLEIFSTVELVSNSLPKRLQRDLIGRRNEIRVKNIAMNVMPFWEGSSGHETIQVRMINSTLFYI